MNRSASGFTVHAALSAACGVSTLSDRFVYVIDDDREVRRATSFMLAANDFQSRPFAGGPDFLGAIDELDPGCILLDIRMPEMDGFEVMKALAEQDLDWPVIMMTGHGEIPIAVQAMKLGASDFIEKPFGEGTLMTSIAAAFARLDARRAESDQVRLARRRTERLTGREHEVLMGLLDGLTNKGIAKRLGISLRTVEMHRANMMARLQVDSLAEALSLAIAAGIKPSGSAAA